MRGGRGGEGRGGGTYEPVTPKKANKQGKQCCSTGSLYVLYMLTD